MKKIDLTRWLAIGTMVLASTAVSVAKPHDGGKKNGCDSRDKRCTSVPDGGSTAAYLLIAGSACLGAIVIRNRRLNQTRPE